MYCKLRIVILDKPDILSVKLTEVGHEKDINSVCIAPNNQTIATGSQDKLIKVIYFKIIIITYTHFFFFFIDMVCK